MCWQCEEGGGEGGGGVWGGQCEEGGGEEHSV